MLGAFLHKTLSPSECPVINHLTPMLQVWRLVHSHKTCQGLLSWLELRTSDSDICTYSFSRPGRELGSAHPLGHTSEGLATETKNVKNCIAGTSLASARSGVLWGTPPSLGKPSFPKVRVLGDCVQYYRLFFPLRDLRVKAGTWVQILTLLYPALTVPLGCPQK